ncbi:type II toxin-antitoxin system VapC family toxin [Telmatospirillum siberiense]|uniref:VapC toxin family PIN domain ribonuclease n=1 Tax=Telmatospirillum siberiense TaxID=382514 RepID=A0A2N3PLU3_9PROT|nr:type II toxin-antitoxin system VapC family toxin [Telmatospirillum siberiense]PKU21370.1 VapC toxin family PIN domain ribonuclease [Telmatospirillum siberiense]
MSGGRRYLLDTNIVSETRKVHMNDRVRAFLTEMDASSLYISVLTVGELRKGVEIKRRSDPDAAILLNGWVDGLEQSFADRIVAIDTPIARLWGELSSDRSRPVIDTLIAATALTHDMILVTRNTKDLDGIDVALHDPWGKDRPGVL